MLGSKTKRSFNAAAATRLNPRVLECGMEESRQIAGQELRDRAKGAQIQYGYTTPQDEGGEVNESLSSEGRYEYVRDFGGRQVAISVTMAAAFWAWPAKFDPPALYRHLDSFATAISDRGMGFCGPRLLPAVLWYAAVAAKNGVTCDRGAQLVDMSGGIFNSAPQLKILWEASQMWRTLRLAYRRSRIASKPSV